MHADLLFVMAEIAAAFAGFSSLVAAIARRDSNDRDQLEFDFRTLRNVLLLSLQAIAYALLPTVIEGQGVSSELSFRLSACVFFLAGGPYLAFTLRQIPNAYSRLSRTVPLSFWINAGAVIIAVGAQAFVGLGLLPIHTYLIALALFLYCAGFGFVRLFVSLRPS